MWFRVVPSALRITAKGVSLYGAVGGCQASDTGFEPRGLETMRREARGPKFSRVSHRVVRYHVADLDAWLREHVQ